MREQVLAYLEKYKYQYEEHGRAVKVKLDLSQHVTITFSDDGKMCFEDQLVGWNFLTGFIPAKLKTALIVNSIFVAGLIVLTMLLIAQENSRNLIWFAVAGIAFFLSCMFYYTLQLKSFKSKIISEALANDTLTC